MAKAILFDFWGTLVETGTWSPLKQVRNILGIHMPFSEYVVKIEHAFMKQKFATLQEAFEYVCKEFKVSCSQNKMEQLIGVWNKSWMLAKPYQETERVLSELQKEHTLFLISNTDSISVPKVLEKFNLKKYFKGVFFSFDLQLLKSEKQFIERVLAESGISNTECLLVGDSIQSDMKTAEQAGIRGILVDRKGNRVFDPKINNLTGLLEQI